MDHELLQWATAMGVGGVLAAAMFAAYRQDRERTEKRYEEIITRLDKTAEAWIKIVQENTAAFTRNTEVVQSLHSHMFEGERRK